MTIPMPIVHHDPGDENDQICPCSSDNQPGDTCSACREGTLPSTCAPARTILSNDGGLTNQPTLDSDKEGGVGAVAPRIAPDEDGFESDPEHSSGWNS